MRRTLTLAVAGVIGCAGTTGHFSAGLLVGNEAQLNAIAQYDRIEGSLEIRSASSHLLLERLKQIDGDLRIQVGSDLTRIEFPKLERIGEDLIIGHGAMSFEVAGLFLHDEEDTDSASPAKNTLLTAPRLAEVLGNVNISGTRIESLTLPNLATIGGSMEVKSNSILQAISLPELTHVKGALSIEDNPEVTNISTPSLLDTTGPLEVARNSKLAVLEMTQLQGVAGKLRISGSPLRTVDLSSLKEVTASDQVEYGGLSVSDTLVHRLGLPSLEHVVGDFTVGPNFDRETGLNELDCPEFVSVTGNFEVKDPRLTKLFLDHLKSVGGSLEIDGTLALVALDLSRLETVGESLTVQETNIARLDLPALESIGGLFEIETNSQLEHVDAPRLERIDSINISRNKLSSCSTAPLQRRFGKYESTMLGVRPDHDHCTADELSTDHVESVIRDRSSFVVECVEFAVASEQAHPGTYDLAFTATFQREKDPILTVDVAPVIRGGAFKVCVQRRLEAIATGFPHTRKDQRFETVVPAEIHGVMRPGLSTTGIHVVGLFGEHGINLWSVQRVLLIDEDRTAIMLNDDGRIAFVNVSSHRIERIFRAPGGVEDGAVSPDEKYLVTGDSSLGEVRIWEIESLAEIGRIETGHKWGVLVQVSPDGALIRTTSRDQKVRYWRLESGFVGKGEPEAREVRAGTWTWNQLGFTPDGAKIIVGDKAEPLEARRVAIAADGSVLATYDGNALKIRDLKRGEVWTPQAPLALEELRVSKSGRWTTGLTGNGVTVWDTKQRTELGPFYPPEDAINTATVTNDGRTVVAGGNRGRLWFFDVASKAESRSIVGHNQGVQSIAYSPDGQRLVSGARDGKVLLWDTNSTKIIQLVGTHSGSVTAVAFSADGQSVLSGDEHGLIRLWRVGRKKMVWEMKAHRGAVYNIAIAKGGLQLLSAGQDGNVILRTLRDGQVVLEIKGAITTPVGEATFTTDGKGVLTGEGNGGVIMWSAKSGAKMKSFVTTIRANHITPSNDGHYALLSGRFDGLGLLDLQTGEVLYLTGHKQGSHQAVLSQDAKLAASVCHDETIRVWDLVKGSQLGVLPVSSNTSEFPRSIAFAPNADEFSVGMETGAILKLRVER